VLQKEARAKWKVVDRTNAYITTTSESVGLIASAICPDPPKISNLVGAIELSKEENILAEE
jgi:hypothetical protein